MSPAEIRRVLHAALDRIALSYAFPDAAATLASALGPKIDSGQYDTVSGALALVRAFNKDIRAVVSDHHLNFGYSAEPNDPNASEDSQEARAALREEAVRSGFGVQALERLPGNVGYLDYTKFPDPEYTGEGIAAAFTLLSGTDALIIDMRNNAGGNPYTVAQLVSYFLPAEPVKLSELYFTPDKGVRQIWSQPFVSGPRYLERPVYVLTSERTYSGAEAFCVEMREHHLATLVGKTTRGGANPARWFVLDAHFAVQVPIGRPLDPGKSWEGVGVKPDADVPSADALDAAKLLAWKELLSRAKDDDAKSALRELIAGAEKRPPKAP